MFTKQSGAVESRAKPNIYHFQVLLP
ncbi:uncharacterized protein METZ01_LOCUS463633 [marine metagenome]|uniref:Uncharacterized protein n=1 Tax=marine metagenome TaxID=408172 RepID=A0A383ATA1_9ZZZZ